MGDSGHVEHAVIGYGIGCEAIGVGIANADVHEMAFYRLVVDGEASFVLHVCRKAKSMMIYKGKYAPKYCIRISGRNFGMVDGTKSVPLYAVFCI